MTTHGFAINVHNDLRPFGWVVPCGLDGVQMTSIAEETHAGGEPPALEVVQTSMARHFAQTFQRGPIEITTDGLHAAVQLEAEQPI